MARERHMTGEEIMNNPERFEAKMRRMRELIDAGKDPKTGRDARRQRVADRSDELTALIKASSEIYNQSNGSGAAEKKSVPTLNDPKVIAVAHGEDPETGEVKNWQRRAEFLSREARKAQGYPPEITIIRKRAERKKRAARQRTEPELAVKTNETQAPTVTFESTAQQPLLAETVDVQAQQEQPVSVPVTETVKADQNPWIEKDRAAEMAALREAYSQLHPEDLHPEVSDFYADPAVVALAHGEDPKTGEVKDWKKRTESMARMARIKNGYSTVPSSEQESILQPDAQVFHSDTARGRTGDSWQDQFRQTYTAMNERVVAGVNSFVEWTKRFRRDNVRQAISDTSDEVSRRVDPVGKRVADAMNQEATPLISAVDAFLEMRQNDLRRARIAFDVFRGRAANIDEVTQLQKRNEELETKMDESLESSNIIKRGQAVWDSLAQRIRRSS